MYFISLQCSYEDAPLLIAVPHSTIMDIIGIVYSSSVPVAKESVKNIPIIGVIGRFLQVSNTIYIQVINILKSL